jgi:hypothetical protein
MVATFFPLLDKGCKYKKAVRLGKHLRWVCLTI